MNVFEIKEFLEKSEHNWCIDVVDDALVITTEDDIKAVLTKSNSQILIESLLFPVSALSNPAEFDSTILHVHKTLPLTTVGKSLVNEEEYYCAFGALSSESKVENIELEVSMLFVNIIELLQFATRFFKSNSEEK